MKIDASMIPDEALIAAMNTFDPFHDGSAYNFAQAIAAALNAWPNWEGSWGEDSKSGELWRTIILPLPQKEGDA